MQGLDLNLFFFSRKISIIWRFRTNVKTLVDVLVLIFSKNFSKICDLSKFRSLVGNTVDVGGPTNKSGCLPTTVQKYLQNYYSNSRLNPGKVGLHASCWGWQKIVFGLAVPFFQLIGRSKKWVGQENELGTKIIKCHRVPAIWFLYDFHFSFIHTFQIFW